MFPDSDPKLEIVVTGYNLYNYHRKLCLESYAQSRKTFQTLVVFWTGSVQNNSEVNCFQLSGIGNFHGICLFLLEHKSLMLKTEETLCLALLDSSGPDTGRALLLVTSA